MGRPINEGYDAAQVCLEGHMINHSAFNMPKFNKHKCPECGEATVTACSKCGEAIQGRYYFPGSLSDGPKDPPKFCHNCGNPYPWTERKKAAALEMFLELLDIEKEQEEELKRNLDAITTNTSRTEVAALKIKRMIGKAGKEAATMLRDAVVNIGSEIAVRAMFPDGK